ncbi:MAG: LuxR C-terminal-related transcriptional regulator [Hyphomicrobiales bacterium]
MRLDRLEQIGHGLGAVSDALGTAGFEQQLAEFLGSLIRHDMMTITRYSLVRPPAFLAHTANYPSDLAARYLERYHLLDPFAAYWRETRKPGVVSLSDLSADRRKVDRYVREFLPESGIADEIGLFLPPLAGSSLAFFYESTSRRFGKSDKDLLSAVYPSLAGLYRAHLAVFFNSPPEEQDPSPNTEHPMLITDRSGRPIWTTRAWADLPNEHLGEIEAMLERGLSEDLQITPLGDDRALMAEPMGPPGAGAADRILWVLETGIPARTEQDPLRVGTWAFDQGLSPREREIVQLVLKGYPTSLIAEKLGLTRGTVKNHRRRIYDKLDITSERELFLIYIEVTLGAGPQNP